MNRRYPAKQRLPIHVLQRTDVFQYVAKYNLKYTSHFTILSRVLVTKTGFGLVIGFINRL
jgi:hypothetical protein